MTDAGLLPAIIERFAQDFPRAVLYVPHEDIAVMQYDNLRERKAELVFGRLPAKMTEPDLMAETLFGESLVVVASAENPWAKRRNLTLADWSASHGCWRSPAVRRGHYMTMCSAVAGWKCRPPGC